MKFLKKKEKKELSKEEKEKKEEKKKEKKGIWKTAFSDGKLKKKKVAVLFLRNNSRAETYELESKKGFFNIHGRNYHEDRDCVYTMGKERYPLCIIPEWSLIPYGTQKWHDKGMLEKFAELEDHTLRGIRHAELVKMGDRDGVKVNAKTWILIGLAVIIGIAVLLGYK